MTESTPVHIVQVDGSLNVQGPDCPHTLSRYRSTKISELAERIQDADIVLVTVASLPYDVLMSSGPKVKLIASLGVGYDNVSMQAVKERGLTLVNVPAQNTDSVVEHAFALYSAVKRNIVPLHSYTLEGKKWELSNVSCITEYSRIPKTNKEETLGVIGYGSLGRGAEKMGKALGMRTLVAERKGASEIRSGRVPFEQVLKQCTVLIMTCPLTPHARNMVDEAELRTMRDDAIIVNVGRGGIINELALARALRESRIAGAAIDVFETEPATKENCPLLDPSIPNLLLTPHVAWYSTGTIKGTLEVTKRNIELFLAGTPQNVIHAGSA